MSDEKRRPSYLRKRNPGSINAGQGIMSDRAHKSAIGQPRTAHNYRTYTVFYLRKYRNEATR